MVEQPRARPTGLFLVIVIGLVVILLLAMIGGQLTTDVAATIRETAGGARGPAGRLALIAVAGAFTFLTVLLPLPAEAAAILNGVLFAPAFAFGLTWTMSMLGAAASYEAGRRYGRGPAGRLFGAGRVTRMERLIERAGWPLLLGLRLSPVMAFTALNWVSGILALSRPVFYATTAAGLAPGTFVFAVTPGLIADRQSGLLLLGVGLAVAAALVSIAVVRAAK